MSDKDLTHTAAEQDQLIGFDSENAKLATVIPLTSEKKSTAPSADRITNSKNTSTGCSTESQYDDIIYHPQTRCFWLLTKDTSNTLGEASNKFSKAIQVPNPEARLAALSDFKITDMFVTPRIQEFLEEPDKQQYENLCIYIVAMEQELEEIRKQRIIYNGMDVSGQKLTDRQIQAQINLTDYRVQKKQLENKAIKIAESKGYAIQDSRIYTPNQIKIKELLDAYTESIADVAGFKGSKYATIFEYIGYYQKVVNETSDNIHKLSAVGINTDNAAIYVAIQSFRQSNAQETLKKHSKLITDLANLGIAVPEFAFCQKDTQQGVADYLSYMNILEDINEKIEKLNDEFESWVKFLGNNAKNVPASVFNDNVKEILTLREQVKEKRQKAEKQIDNLPIPMLCVWDASQFAPKPVDFLFKAIKPLQEYSSPKELKLSHIALKSLSKRVEDDLTNLVNNSPIESLNDNRQEIELFEQYLKDQGCLKIELKEDWFYPDEDSNTAIFSYEDFFEYLTDKCYTVTSLNDKSKQQQWGGDLQKIIFSSQVLTNIMLFDTTPGAALIRSLTGRGGMISYKTEVEGPKLKRWATDSEIKESQEPQQDVTTGPLRTKGIIDKGTAPAPGKLANAQITSGELKLVVSPLKGEITIADFTFPELNSKAAGFYITYIDKDNNTKKVHIGDFYLRLVTKVWGFVGASVMLSGDVSIGVNNGKLGLDSLYKANIGGKAQADLFAGVQAGINFMGEVRWVPPEHLKSGEEILGLSTNVMGSNTPQQTTPNSKPLLGITANYRVISRVEAAVAGAFGGGISGGFGFGLENRKFYFYIRAKVIWGAGASGSLGFEIDYGALASILRMLAGIVRDANYIKIDCITPDAFSYLSYAYLLFMVAGGPIFWMTFTLDKLIEIYDTVMGPGNMDKIAGRLINPKYEAELREWMRTIPPEALGPLLYNLSKPATSWGSYDRDVIGLQQTALANILTWLVDNEVAPFSISQPNATQILFEKALARMGIYGAKVDRPKTAYCENIEKLKEMMDKPSSLDKKVFIQILNSFNDSIQRLNRHMEGQCEVRYLGSSQKRIRYIGTDKDE